MRTLKHFLSLFILTASVSLVASEKANAQGATVSFQVFYDDLSPYGTWVNSPAYGYVWIPDAGAGFSPYATNGYWVYTDYGWTWISNYSWGWAPFHYGRWYADPYYGQVWVPGNEWGPGWVTWRHSNGYYGWASMGPGGYYVQDNSWTFVEVDHFGGTTINNYYLNKSGNTAIIKNTTVINNSHTHSSSHITYNAGPDRNEVEKHNGKKITPFVVKDNSSHSQQMSNGQVVMYKPTVEKNGTGSKHAPSKVSDMKDGKEKQNDKVPVPNKQPVTTPKEQNTKQPQQTQPKKQYQPQPKQQPVQQQPQKQQPVQQQPKQQQPKQQVPQQQPQPKQQPQPQPQHQHKPK
jgi:hypothetical protein